IVIDPNNPSILFAAMWQIEIHTWGRASGGPGSGIWMSRDAGTTWKRLAGNGLPTRTVGKIGLAMTKADSNRVYALIETGRGIPWNGEATDVGTLWRSDDGGADWQLVNSNSSLLARPAYFTRMAVAPDDENEAHFLAIGFSTTRDGGRTLAPRSPSQSPGFDNHDMWIDPTDGNRMIVANDEGVAISINRGNSWNRIKLPIAQLYRVTTDNRVPYTVCGNMQDGPSTCGPSNSKIGSANVTGGADIPRGLWYSVGGGESGWATPDPVDPNIVWSTASGRGSVGGIVVRYDVRAKAARDVEVWPVSTNGHPAAEVKYRFIWDFPILISPHDPNRIYVGSQFVHSTTNGGQSWQLISPDLTLNDKSKQQHSGGLTGDNIGVEYGDVVYAIAESPVTRGLIWAGTNDGLVQLTRDGGKSWVNVTKNVPGLIAWGTIGNIEPSRYDAGTAYITVNAHQEGNFDPWVYKTADYGQTWKLIVNGIPKGPLSFARCVREDPVRRGLLYLGTENGLYVSFDDGGNWQPLQLNLPHAPVSWLTVQRHFNDLVVSTYGRGFYILDDLTPLQEMTPAIAGSAAHLFAPHSAYRFRTIENGIREMSDDPTAGRNPPYGASLSYWLKSAPAGDVVLTIADSTGKVVRTFVGSKTEGVNRVYWDLRFDPSSPAYTGLDPLSGSLPPRGPEEGSPPGRVRGPGGGATRMAGGAGSVRILAPPGRYTVKLRAGGRELTQPLILLKDPDSGGSLQEIAAQTSMLQDLSADLDSAVALSNELASLRSQLRTLAGKLASDASMTDVRAAAETLERKLMAVADTLRQGKAVAFYEWPVKLEAKLSYLANHVQSSDRGPTDQAREAYAFLKDQLRVAKAAYDDVLRNDLSPFNELLRRRGLQAIATATR
ncbi:MAG TPA: sialidase, partial [Blastocatellia bacterium]|nr:sialidase [Blastocatellia bacterium]